MNDSFWNWFAGFWEGEGAVGVYKGKQVEICACQKVREPLDYIYENIGIGKVVLDTEKGTRII